MMNIEHIALKFAIEAHKNQVRKSEVDKPMIIHPINVGNILKEYSGYISCPFTIESIYIKEYDIFI